eukprot:Rhum_TRINITY_DN4761_c0_g2::Rhum_TRINITY_DN4761_c0_g2_i1::g.15597::m.15597
MSEYGATRSATVSAVCVTDGIDLDAIADDVDDAATAAAPSAEAAPCSPDEAVHRMRECLDMLRPPPPPRGCVVSDGVDEQVRQATRATIHARAALESFRANPTAVYVSGYVRERMADAALQKAHRVSSAEDTAACMRAIEQACRSVPRRQAHGRSGDGGLRLQ